MNKEKKKTRNMRKHEERSKVTKEPV